MTFKCQKHVAKSQFDELNWNSKSYRSIIIDNWIFKSADRSGPCWLDAAGRRLIHSLERWLTTWSGRVSFLWFHISHFIFHKFFLEWKKRGGAGMRNIQICVISAGEMRFVAANWVVVCVSWRRFDLWPFCFSQFGADIKNPSKILQKSLRNP